MNAPDPELLSINTATVRKQWSLPEIVAGCARHGIRFISPWRDQVAAAGLKESAQRIRDAGLRLSGLLSRWHVSGHRSRGTTRGAR